ncbi:hypothetical protein AURDEDRAFT_125406 [Auricularia subglabra TFB-10046 SS5]|nr:hypothetical protein AURDEDRAFT_125406 [Auricularia subglabra TFB-10046 SS5]
MSFADVDIESVGLIPATHLSCYMSVRNPFSNITAPTLLWDRSGKFHAQVTPSRWAAQVVSLNPNWRTFREDMREVFKDTMTLLDWTPNNTNGTSALSSDTSTELVDPRNDGGFIINWVTGAIPYMQAVVDVVRVHIIVLSAFE